jgi:UDP-N-acetyl-2-amino-2-deoxyglucuronate dehydrogenase
MIKYRPIEGRKIRVAVIGCGGRIAGKHFEAFERHANDLAVTAVCDVDPQALEKWQKSTGAKGYASYTDLLDRSDADVVVLATPSGLHSSQAILAARAGKHVVTEKPMATRWMDGIAMVKACDEAAVRLFVVKQNRRNTTLQLLKRAVEQKRFGRIFMVTINVFWSRPQDYYDSAKWRGTWEFDGGALMNQASHYVDLVDWLIGPVESVHAYIATLARAIQVEDTATVGVRWRSGALGSVNVTMLAFPKNYEGSITIVGEKGLVRVGGVAVNEIQTWQFADSHPDDQSVKAASHNVISTLRGQAEPETDGREGLRSLEVLIASYLSARDGRRVALPLDY